MESLNKYDNEEVELKNHLIRVGDLINMDGPMLVVFRDTMRNNLYLFDWVDNDNESNRWLIYKVDKSDLINFLKTKISYKSLFEKNNKILYFTDIVSEQLKAFKIFKLKKVPNDYKPDKDVFFDIKDSKNLGKILKILNLDDELKEIILSKDYNVIIGAPIMDEIRTQDHARPQIQSSKSNFLPKKIILTQIHTQPDASKSNRIPKQKGLVLQ